MRKGFIDGIALGAFLTLLAFLICALLFYFRLFGNSFDIYAQTLITALATAATGYLAVRGIREQIQENIEAEKQRRYESLRAARATLPIALSDVIRISRKMQKAIFSGKLASVERDFASLNSPNLFETLTKCIQYSDQQSGDRLSQLIRYIQVLQARYEEKYFKGAIPPHEMNWFLVGTNRIDYAIGWAVLDAICTSAFGYARGSKSQIPDRIELKAVYGAFITAQIMPEDYPRLVETIESRWKSRRLEMKFDND